ncbi:CRISPR-associated protein Cas4 [Halobacillus amylolyticus]|uniref:CRISPR-associated exonuclease Cas4 n=1 Tax=Halobacillus amylolyticus TaxID=2932259 RepID=A0ABY4HFB0_9BACI|nr:CRISPR-associated protein Cas4 [Halobacillus amylolyticus]UOR13568.1 CRISPR-associated protein Cas4 [Halobacillus amylolyticus]
MDSNEEADLLLSGIQHFQFCKRQWALIHVEQQWEENVRTVEGQHIHKKADQPFIKEKRKNKLIVRALPVQSDELGATGICDVVEFIEDKDGVPIQNSKESYVPVPVEYKRGKPKKDNSDILQLTAQAMCLEEMLLCEVSVGYIFYNELKHRVEIPITHLNKVKVRQMFREMHSYFDDRHTPKVKTGPHCKSCSLQNVCLPELMKKQSVSKYIERKINE